MAFLRLSRHRLSEVKARKRKSLEDERNDWISQRQQAAKSRSVELLGKTFTTKRKAAAYAKRLLDGDWHNGTKPAQAGKVQSGLHVKASMATKRYSDGRASDCIRVREINGVWRRYVETADGWRWISDHASMDDALAPRNALNDPE